MASIFISMPTWLEHVLHHLARLRVLGAVRGDVEEGEPLPSFSRMPPAPGFQPAASRSALALSGLYR